MNEESFFGIISEKIVEGGTILVGVDELLSRLSNGFALA
jgi:hypothetical protein